jgi:hypothetical protein
LVGQARIIATQGGKSKLGWKQDIMGWKFSAMIVFNRSKNKITGILFAPLIHIVY